MQICGNMALMLPILELISNLLSSVASYRERVADITLVRLTDLEGIECIECYFRLSITVALKQAGNATSTTLFKVIVVSVSRGNFPTNKSITAHTSNVVP